MSDMKKKVFYIILISTCLGIAVFSNGKVVFFPDDDEDENVFALEKENSDNSKSLLFRDNNIEKQLGFINPVYFISTEIIFFIIVGFFLYFRKLFIGTIPIRAPPASNI